SNMLAGAGYSEVLSYSFADKRLLEKLGYKITDLKKVINGLSPETEYLRPNILASLLTAIAKNPWAPEIKIFEIGKVFGVNPRESASKEKWQLGIAQSNKDFNDLKNVLGQLGCKFDILKIDQEILDFLKIRKRFYYILIDLDTTKLKSEKFTYQLSKATYNPISRFSPTIRDLAFIVDTSVNAYDINSEILKLDKHILLCELFDEFSSDKFGKNKKNIAYHIWLQDMNHPMDEREVNEIINKIIKFVNDKYSAKLRS
ncbi:MAG: hypothetical protein M1338_05205, partial [Patescibacteria group bacterium]|nr:hypothetical protein [Patescibacteria group bacterium]